MLLKINDNILLRRSGVQNVKDSLSHGQFGLNEGLLPYVADAIQIFNASRESISDVSIKKCELKSDILSAIDDQSSKNCILELNETEIGLNSCLNPIEQCETNITTDLGESGATFQSQVLLNCSAALSSISSTKPNIFGFIE